MKKHQGVYRAILLSALVVGTGNREAAAAAPPAYHVTDLGTLGGFFSTAYDINDRGQVTGRSNTTGDEAYHAFLWTPATPNGTSGTMTDLGTPSGIPNSSGEGINNRGHVIGFYGPTDFFGDTESFLWTPTTPNGESGSMQGLGTLGGTTSYGFGINDSGQLTGSFLLTGVGPHAFLYDGTLHDLGTLGGNYSSGYRINDRGQVTGSSKPTANATEHPFLWTPTTPNGTSGAMIDLGSFGGTLSGGTGINDSGQVVGYSYLPGDTFYHAFLWTPTTPNGTSGTMIDLGSFGGTFSAADGINSSGQVVGWTRTTGDADEHAFLYTISNGMVDLNSLIDPVSGWELAVAWEINDVGQIAGSGVIGGQGHAFLLTPVPEPATLALIGLGVAALAIRRCRRITKLLFLMCALSATAAAHAASYIVTDLGVSGAENTLGWGINASGQVAGYASSTIVGDDTVTGFLWNPTIPNSPTGTLHDLGALGGNFSWGIGINAAGQVSGVSATADETAEHASVWIPTTPNGATGTMYDLGTLGGTYSQGTGINDSGQLTGYSDLTGDLASHAMIWKPDTFGNASGTMHDLGTLGGTQSFGWDINDGGQVTGDSSTTGDVTTHAMLWTPTTLNGTTGTMHDLLTLGGTMSGGEGISDKGQVAGYSQTSNDEATHAFLWTPTTPGGTSGTMLDLGTLDGSDSYGIKVSAAGQVVGSSYVPAEVSNYSHAFLYTSGVGMVDLNTLIDPLSGWELLDASDINDAGQITGQGLINDEYHAYLLTPTPIPGDFDSNGIVDAADYTVWRDGLGSTYTMADYDVWKAHFGQSLGSGATGSASPPAVPEPGLFTFAAAGLFGLSIFRRRPRPR